ncbi:MAG: phospholipase effector Tle1 domain-containing protein [Pseudomonadota bacterium]
MNVSGWSKSAFCLTLILVVLLGGCSSIVHKPQLASSAGSHKIAIFFDGTRNDIADDTNVKRLHSLVSLQRRTDVSTLYIEGVGVGTDVIGAATGLGMAPRVKIAYEFLLNHYRDGDEIYIFGFSRGAYAARILSAMLYHAGLVKSDERLQMKSDERLQSTEIAKAVFDAYKFPFPEELRADNERVKRGSITFGSLEVVFDAPKEVVSRRNQIKVELEKQKLKVGAPVSVDVLGLWDTVEAMGLPDWDSRMLHRLGIKQHLVDVDGKNTRYGEQLCNVKRAYQAHSIDDDREWIFTPLSLTRTYLFKQCDADGEHLLDKEGKIIPGRLREVWFSGAHSDVGGGYGDSLLSGVSLNWMIKNLTGKGNGKYDEKSDAGLLPSNAGVPEDMFGSSHDPESGVWSLLYHKMSRDIATYVTDKYKRRGEFGATLCVHKSVLERRNLMGWEEHENGSLSLLEEGVVYLKETYPYGKDEIWKPRLREIKKGELRNPLLTMKIEVWPNCTGMNMEGAQ